MATKLKFLFRDPQSALLFKTLVFGGAFLFTSLSGFRPMPLAVFLFLSGFFYLKLLTNAFAAPFFLPFATLIGCAVFLFPLLLKAAPSAVWVVVFSLLFYLIVGIKEVLFVHRVRWYAVETLTLLYILFLAFFLVSGGAYSFLGLIGISLITFFLLRGAEGFPVMSSDMIEGKAWNLAASVLALIAAELLWIVGFLPLSALSAAAFVAMALVMLTDIALRSSRSDILASAIVTDIGMLIFLAAFLLLTSSWKP